MENNENKTGEVSPHFDDEQLSKSSEILERFLEETPAEEIRNFVDKHTNKEGDPNDPLNVTWEEYQENLRKYNEGQIE